MFNVRSCSSDCNEYLWDSLLPVVPYLDERDRSQCSMVSVLFYQVISNEEIRKCENNMIRNFGMVDGMIGGSDIPHYLQNNIINWQGQCLDTTNSSDVFGEILHTINSISNNKLKNDQYATIIPGVLSKNVLDLECIVKIFDKFKPTTKLKTFKEYRSQVVDPQRNKITKSLAFQNYGFHPSTAPSAMRQSMSWLVSGEKDAIFKANNLHARMNGIKPSSFENFVEIYQIYTCLRVVEQCLQSKRLEDIPKHLVLALIASMRIGKEDLIINEINKLIANNCIESDLIIDHTLKVLIETGNFEQALMLLNELTQYDRIIEEKNPYLIGSQCGLRLTQGNTNEAFELLNQLPEDEMHIFLEIVCTGAFVKSLKNADIDNVLAVFNEILFSVSIEKRRGIFEKALQITFNQLLANGEFVQAQGLLFGMPDELLSAQKKQVLNYIVQEKARRG